MPPTLVIGFWRIATLKEESGVFSVNLFSQLAFCYSAVSNGTRGLFGK
jgi:hypothetical protein